MDFQTGQKESQIRTALDVAVQSQYHNGTLGRSIPEAPLETVGHLINLLMSQSSELRERSSYIASQVAGSYPAPDSNKQPQPDSLLALLRAVSANLSAALSEAERTQRNL